MTQVPFATVNAVASAVAGPGQDADRNSLKSLMSNVTSDYHQVMQPHFHVAPARLALTTAGAQSIWSLIGNGNRAPLDVLMAWHHGLRGHASCSHHGTLCAALTMFMRQVVRWTESMHLPDPGGAHVQLANLLQEFVQSSDVPPETEARLRSFLSSKASMCATLRSRQSRAAPNALMWLSPSCGKRASNESSFVLLQRSRGQFLDFDSL